MRALWLPGPVRGRIPLSGLCLHGSEPAFARHRRLAASARLACYASARQACGGTMCYPFTLHLRSRAMRRMFLTLAALGLAVAIAGAQRLAPNGEWRYYGGDAASTK